MSGVNLTLSQGGHTIGTSQRSSSLADASLPFLTASLRVGSKSSHVSTLTYLGWCNVQLFLFYLQLFH